MERDALSSIQILQLLSLTVNFSDHSIPLSMSPSLDSLLVGCVAPPVHTKSKWLEPHSLCMGGRVFIPLQTLGEMVASIFPSGLLAPVSVTGVKIWVFSQP
jgi:hypothetical protein